MLFLVVAFHLLVSYLQVSYQKEFSQSLLSKAEDISSDLGSSIQEASALSPLSVMPRQSISCALFFLNMNIRMT